MVGSVFLVFQNKPPKWRIFKYSRWVKEIKNYNKKPKDGILKYR